MLLPQIIKKKTDKFYEDANTAMKNNKTNYLMKMGVLNAKDYKKITISK